MSSLQKKVILRRFFGDVLHGYLPASGFVHNDEISYLSLQGRMATISLPQVKTICYVRDFNLADTQNPERLQRKSFVTRPRGDGLWVRITFRDDGDLLEGLCAADTTFLDGLITDEGVSMSPPDSRTNTQRIYVPRASIATLQVLAVITSPSKRRSQTLLERDAPAGQVPPSLQEALFEGAPQLSPKRGRHGHH